MLLLFLNNTLRTAEDMTEMTSSLKVLPPKELFLLSHKVGSHLRRLARVTCFLMLHNTVKVGISMQIPPKVVAASDVE
jgi:hypothetical protein